MILRIIPDNTHINFVKYSTYVLWCSVILLLFAVAVIFFKGLHIGLDFAGGIVIDLQVEKENLTLSDIRNVLHSGGLSNFSIQKLNDSDKEFLLNFQSLDNLNGLETISKIKNSLKAVSDNIIYNKIDYVGPQVGHEQIIEGIYALICSLIGMFIYLCYRFKWQFAIGGVAALIHDVVLTLGMISIVNIEFNLTSVAGLLMIIGYSVNDSVVIYNRIQELIRKSQDSKNLQDIVNIGINSTLSRTILTSGTTLLATVPLILLCKGLVRDLGIIIFFGITVGTYSSIFISVIPFIKSLQKRGQ
ncbi:protein translocase subunit SecF [Neoehrlichia mikurensis]|uniref:Protein-export membrane protein SecF n=1 Tax=Neoehrlichia mikurensis TaxID=89586 RepID=A0A9Q9C0L2_9RICK|nr:protein translocase subunit SecF [Neoehrlichia mikurensis]QXK92273.1 protein translocase subunit SecF [Neoehrlichia mikurensis]QXK92727.1 protein translocase subunit SecF [Neoehrlichia mikurensis]QXK93967.1 protein translocase subunit SecF [Neoehrlichia mikurensis]UTO55869.1 protein translocase subunit SecF [Neoehrlichia mikurensis]UTO56785.1 protein translocase subunit SecF [Neoehrlichia mikurensis]